MEIRYLVLIPAQPRLILPDIFFDIIRSAGNNDLPSILINNIGSIAHKTP